jgi:hypothetical protein
MDMEIELTAEQKANQAAFTQIGEALSEVGASAGVDPAVLVAETGTDPDELEAAGVSFNRSKVYNLRPIARVKYGAGKRRRGGANTCSRYYKFLLKTLIVTAIGVALSVGGPYVAGAVPIGQWISSGFAALNASCVGGPLGWTGLQIGYCGLLTKLQAELLSLIMNQNLETLKTALLAISATIAGLSLKETIKKVWNDMGGLLDTVVNDFCESVHKVGVQVDAGTQTVMGDVDAVGPRTRSKKITDYLVPLEKKKDQGGKRLLGGDGYGSPAGTFPARGGGFGEPIGKFPAAGGRKSKKTRKTRPKKMGKSRRARRVTSRTPLFIY